MPNRRKLNEIKYEYLTCAFKWLGQSLPVSISYLMVVHTKGIENLTSEQRERLRMFYMNKAKELIAEKEAA